MSTEQTPLKSILKKRGRSGEGIEGGPSTSKKRVNFGKEYDKLFLKYGFIRTDDSDVRKLICIVCGDQFSEDIKFSELLSHVTTKHPETKDKPLEYFERKRRKDEEQKKCIIATTSLDENVLRASYLLAYHIAKAKKPLTIGEELILPCTKDIVRELLGEAAVKEISQVPLSANIVSRYIEEIAEDIETQLLKRINASPWYALQVAESIDIDKTVLLVYVRYLYQEDLHEDFLCALSFPTGATGEELFKSLHNYISGKLKWSFCVNIGTDGATAMNKPLSDFTALIKTVAPQSESTYYLIQSEMLASQKLSPELHSVLIDVVNVFVYIKAHALNSETCTLSEGKLLIVAFELKEALEAFLLEMESPLAGHFSDVVWVSKLAYLCDIFNLLNKVNLCHQDKMATVFKLADKVAAIKDKLKLWKLCAYKGIFDMFPTLARTLGETKIESSFCQLVHNHLSSILEQLEHYFPTAKDPRIGREWICDPFANKSGESNITTKEEDQLLEIANDSELKTMFKTTTLPMFWIKVMVKYPEVATIALKSLLPFPTIHLCKEGFSALILAITIQENNLDISKALRVSLSPITPRWNHLVAKKQDQGSH